MMGFLEEEEEVVIRFHENEIAQTEAAINDDPNLVLHSLLKDPCW